MANNSSEQKSNDKRNFIHDAVAKGDRATAYTDKARDGLWGAEDEFGKVERPAHDYRPRNGINFATGEQGALDAPGGGAAAASYSEPIEFVHFGTIYRDARDKFVPPKDPTPIDDTEHMDPPPTEEHRAIHYRAALQREAILIAGFIRSTKRTVKYRFDPSNSSKSQDPGGAFAGVLMGTADIAGGAGSKSLIAEDEVAPFLQELTRVAETINSNTIEYSKLHQAGIDLNVLATSYHEWLKTAILRLKHEPAVGGGMLGAAANVLSPLGIGGPLESVSKTIGPIIGTVQCFASITADSYLRMAFEYSNAMNPAIIDACRAMSVDAIRRKANPPFAVWNKPPAPRSKPKELNSAPGGQSILQDVSDTKDEIVNFLTRPVPRCPGGPFTDMAFEEKGGAGYDVRSKALPKLASKLVAEALGKHGVDVDEPGSFRDYIRTILEEGSRTVIDFLHAVYGVATTLPPDEAIEPAQMIAAGRSHLLNKLAYIPLERFKILGLVRGSGFSFGNTKVNLESLLARGLNALQSALEPALKALDPILEFAMYELATDLDEARTWTTGNFTMEAYFAILPATYAKLVRHLVFFLVDTVLQLFTSCVLNPAMRAMGLPGVGDGSGPLGAASALAGGPLGAVTSGLGFLGDAAQRAGKAVRDAQAVGNAVARGLETAKDLSQRKYGSGCDNDKALADGARAIDDIENAKSDEPEGRARKNSPSAADVAAKTFPFPCRIVKAVGKRITDDELKKAQELAKKMDAAWKDADDSVQASAANKKAHA